MRVLGRAVLAAALLWGAALPGAAADESILVQAPGTAPIQDREQAKIRVLGGATIDTGAMGLVFGQPVGTVAPGAAEVTVPADKLEPALVQLGTAAMTACETIGFDVRPAMRQLERGPWAPFVDLRVSEETGRSEVLAKGETGMSIVSDAPDRRSKSIQLSMLASIQPQDGVRVSSASCGVVMIATDEGFPTDWVDAVFGKRRLGEPQVFPGGEIWRLVPPVGANWPQDRKAQVSILRSPGGWLSVLYRLEQPIAASAP